MFDVAASSSVLICGNLCIPNCTIEAFWRLRLPTQKPKELAGWNSDVATLPTYVEAPLAKGTGRRRGPSRPSPIILVSAAGAVGKSTLARQIASITGAVYLDLAKADPVGGNTLRGGSSRLALVADPQPLGGLRDVHPAGAYGGQLGTSRTIGATLGVTL